MEMVTMILMAMVIVLLMLMPVQLQQGDAEMRQLQSGSREVAFTKQLRCQLKVSSWGVSFSLWPPSPVSDLSFQKYAESHQLLATCNNRQTLIGSKGSCQEKLKQYRSPKMCFWLAIANIQIMLLRQLSISSFLYSYDLRKRWSPFKSRRKKGDLWLKNRKTWKGT